MRILGGLYGYAMRVLFRADATPASGTGHVMRCWALAEDFEDRGAEISWQGRITVPWVRGRIESAGWPIEAAEFLARDQARSVRADLVIVDSYDLDDAYREAYLETGIPVVAIVDDSHTAAGPASLWVNPGAPTGLVTDQPSHFLNGTEYLLIHREIRDLRAFRKSFLSSGSVASGITFLMGGTDFGNMTQVINAIPNPSAITGGVYAGPSRSSSGESDVTWLRGGYELLRRAAKSALVISAAGVSSWEIAYIGVPMGLLQVADNQAGNYAWMTGKGLAVPLGLMGTGGDPDVVLGAIQKLLEHLPRQTQPTHPKIDGFGARRVADAALALL